VAGVHIDRALRFPVSSVSRHITIRLDIYKLTGN
jgi:hypothetical protein